MRFPWVLRVCDEFEEMVPDLLRAECTVIHGECFGSNIVYQQGVSRPIDWQSAAIAPGEIDLASLVLAWPKPVANKMIGAYKKSRWQQEAADDFERTLELARLYMCLRWLGDTALMSQWFRPRANFVIPKDPRRIITELHFVGERLGNTVKCASRSNASAP